MELVALPSIPVTVGKALEGPWGGAGFKGRHGEVGLRRAGHCLGDVATSGKDPAASLPASADPVSVHKEVDKCAQLRHRSFPLFLPPSVSQQMHR